MININNDPTKLLIHKSKYNKIEYMKGIDKLNTIEANQIGPTIQYIESEYYNVLMEEDKNDLKRKKIDPVNIIVTSI